MRKTAGQTVTATGGLSAACRAPVRRSTRPPRHRKRADV